MPEENEIITVQNVLNLTIIPLLNIALHIYVFLRPPTYFREEELGNACACKTEKD
jgi:hypothetical protein